MIRRSYSYARNNLRTLLDDIHFTGEPCLILSTGDKPVVVMKESHYNEMIEELSRLSENSSKLNGVNNANK